MNVADLGWIGIGMLVLGVLLIVLEGVLAMLWTLSLSRKARALSAMLASQQAEVQADIGRLMASLEEMRELWKPYRRLLRLLRHPLTIALMQSYARRRATIR